MTDIRSLLVERAVDALNLGIVVVDFEEKIVIWNQWMARASGKDAMDVVGQKLFEVMDVSGATRLEGALRDALDMRQHQVISQTLNRSPLPLFVRNGRRLTEERLEQSIQVAPLMLDTGDYAMIQVHTINSAIARERVLRRHTEEFRDRAYRDVLTGLWNRRRFDEAIKAELLRARRSEEPMGLIMLDVDHFKLYNDHYGHGGGDECLRKVSHALQAATHRSTDLAARYGGEEFVILLPMTDAEGVKRVAEDVIKKIAEQKLPHAASKVSDHVTVSIGAVCVEKIETDLKEELIEAADRALYRAKEAGRNQYVFERIATLT